MPLLLTGGEFICKIKLELDGQSFRKYICPNPPYIKIQEKWVFKFGKFYKDLYVIATQ